MSISERLKLVCQEKNWKLKDFSEATGLPYRTAQGYLNGTREPNSEGMLILCLKLNININWLLTGMGSIFIDSVLEADLLNNNEYILLNSFRKCNALGQKTIQLMIGAISSDTCFINEVNK